MASTNNNGTRNIWDTAVTLIQKVGVDDAIKFMIFAGITYGVVDSRGRFNTSVLLGSFAGLFIFYLISRIFNKKYRKNARE